MKLTATTALSLATVALVTGPAHAQTFQGRDLTGDGIADAYYHVEQDLTWLTDANYYATQGNPPMVDPYTQNSPQPGYLAPGQVRLYQAGVPYAATWAAGLSIGGVTGWRLPERLVPAGTNGGGLPGLCNATSCAEFYDWPSELTFLGAVLGGQSGPFINVMDGMYMALLPHPQGPQQYVQLYNPRSLQSSVSDETSLLYGYIWAVQDGDVAAHNATVTPVPEPETYALILLSLVAVAYQLRRAGRRTRGADAPAA